MRGPNHNCLLTPAERADPSIIADCINTIIDGTVEQLGLFGEVHLALVPKEVRQRLERVVAAGQSFDPGRDLG